MKAYSKMSDAEISKMVGDLLGVKWANLDDNYHALSIWKDGKLSVFDPCNSWADAGPIIQEYGIELGYDGVAWEASCNLRGIKPYSDWKKYPESPCRLAMIVFLMMHDKGEE